MILALSTVAVVLLIFGFGASVTFLITRDSLCEGLRDRWVEHWAYRQETLLKDIPDVDLVRAAAVDRFLALYNARAHTPLTRETMTRADKREALLHEISIRTAEEAPLPAWIHGQGRDTARPWLAYSRKLVRLKGYQDFIECPFCVGFWVYLGTMAWTWWRVFDCAQVIVPWSVTRLPADYVVIGAAMGLRWLYANIAITWGNGR